MSMKMLEGFKTFLGFSQENGGGASAPPPPPPEKNVEGGNGHGLGADAPKGLLSEMFDMFAGFVAGVQTDGQTERSARRLKFSDVLPYRTYSPETGWFRNVDDTLGVIWECVPLYFSDPTVCNAIEGLLNKNMPSGSVLTVITHADPYIEEFIQRFENLAVYTEEQEPLLYKANKVFAEYLRGSAHGLEKLRGMPLRNYRLIVSVQFPNPKKLAEPDDDMVSTVDGIHHKLKNVGMHPMRWSPKELINWLARLFNAEIHTDIDYDENSFIHDQIHKEIIKAGNPVQVTNEYMKIGKNYWKCLTPWKFKTSTVSPEQARQLIGGIWGSKDDEAQIKTPFLYMANIVFDSTMESTIRTKCNLTQQQSGFGSVSSEIAQRQAEFSTAAADLNSGQTFVHLMPIMWQYGPDLKKLESAVNSTARVVWQKQSVEAQIDWGILQPMFLSSIPFGLKPTKKNLRVLARSFQVPARVAVRCLPIQGGWRGNGLPYVVGVDRNGQFVCLDLWEPGAANYNGVVLAQSGEGKSVFFQYLVLRYLSSGTMCYIVDIGRSYERLCKLFGGLYLRFSDNDVVCLNPFEIVHEEAEGDLPSDIPALTALLYNMIFPNVANPHDEDLHLIEEAATWTVRQVKETGNPNGIDLVYNWLIQFPKFSTHVDVDMEWGKSKERAHKMAYGLHKYTTDGPYGKWFNGRTSHKFTDYKLVVLELEELKQNNKDLFKIVVLQVMDYITKILYLGDRSIRKLVLIEEAHQFLGTSPVRLMQDIIDQGERRARKYNGSMLIVSQGPMDIETFGAVGQSIWDNSNHKFLLYNDNYVKAAAKGIISYHPFHLNLLKSVKSQRPYYSEIFFQSGRNMGIFKVVIPPYWYWLFTTTGSEVAEINEVMDKLKIDALSEYIGHLKTPPTQDEIKKLQHSPVAEAGKWLAQADFNDPKMVLNFERFEQVLLDQAIEQMVAKHG